MRTVQVISVNVSALECSTKVICSMSVYNVRLKALAGMQLLCSDSDNPQQSSTPILKVLQGAAAESIDIFRRASNGR